MVGEIWITPKNVFWKFCEIERFVSARQYCPQSSHYMNYVILTASLFIMLNECLI